MPWVSSRILNLLVNLEGLGVNSTLRDLPIASVLKLSYAVSFKGPDRVISEDSIDSAGAIVNKSKSNMFFSIKSVARSSPFE